MVGGSIDIDGGRGGTQLDQFLMETTKEDRILVGSHAHQTLLLQLPQHPPFLIAQSPLRPNKQPNHSKRMLHVDLQHPSQHPKVRNSHQSLTSHFLGDHMDEPFAAGKGSQVLMCFLLDAAVGMAASDQLEGHDS